jgi:hypothetical protein
MNKQQLTLYKAILEKSIFDKIFQDIIINGLKFYKTRYDLNIYPYLNNIHYTVSKRKDIVIVLSHIEEIIRLCVDDIHLSKLIKKMNNETKYTIMQQYSNYNGNLKQFEPYYYLLQLNNENTDQLFLDRCYFLGLHLEDNISNISNIDYHQRFKTLFDNIYDIYSVMLHYYFSNRQIKKLKNDIRFFSKQQIFYMSMSSNVDKIKKYIKNPLENTPCWDIVFVNLHEKIDYFL